MSWVLEFSYGSQRVVGPFESQGAARAWAAENRPQARKFRVRKMVDPDPKVELPMIPRYRLNPAKPPEFVRFREISDQWLILGREEDIVVGQPLRILRFSDKKLADVQVNGIVARRTVFHDPGSPVYPGKTTFVLAAFSRIK